MKIGVVTFPGTLDDRDAQRAVRLAGAEAVSLWHADTNLHNVDAVVLPGGFSFGDYLRCGAIAAQAPVMESIIDAANGGLPVLGICNGFQVLVESHLLPGGLIRNEHQHFICRDQKLRVGVERQQKETQEDHLTTSGVKLTMLSAFSLSYSEHPCALAL